MSEIKPPTQRVYKICTASQWATAVAAGEWSGSADDLRDGFIHFSTAAQVAETARRFFSGQPDLVLVAFDAADLRPHLRWEPSRGGDLFPHLHAPLPAAAARWTKPLALDAAGTPVMPEGVR